MSIIESLLKRVVTLDCSDLHVQPFYRPRIRARGHLIDVDKSAPFEPGQLEQSLLALLSSQQIARLSEAKFIDFALHNYLGRQWRVHYFYQETGLAAAFRPLPTTVRCFAELNLPEELERLAHFPSGLVLVSGATGAGKTTTLAALVQLINNSYRKTISTLEDPAEYLFDDKRSVIQQREIGTDVPSFKQGIQDAMIFYPDILVIGEILDYDTARMTLRAAETGMLVLATIHGNDAAQTIDRVLDLFPEHEQLLARTMISQSLKAISCQLLLPDIHGQGRLPACEILLRTPAIAHLIRSNRIYDVRNNLLMGKNMGMRHLDQSLGELVDAGVLDISEAHRHAKDKRRFRISAEKNRRRRTHKDVLLPSEVDDNSVERRAEERIRTIVLANIQEYDEMGLLADMTVGRTLDLSSGGVCIELNHPLNARRKIRLHLTVGSIMIQADAFVRSVRELSENSFAIGCRFHKLEPEKQDIIDQHLRLNRPN
jgi:twitching motility protein PilT